MREDPLSPIARDPTQEVPQTSQIASAEKFERGLWGVTSPAQTTYPPDNLLISPLLIARTVNEIFSKDLLQKAGDWCVNEKVTLSNIGNGLYRTKRKLLFLYLFLVYTELRSMDAYRHYLSAFETWISFQ